MKLAVAEPTHAGKETGLISIVESLKPIEVIDLAHAGKCLHVIQRNGLAFEQEMRAARAMLEQPTVFFAHPLEVVLGGSPGSGPAANPVTDLSPGIGDEISAGNSARLNFYFLATPEEKKRRVMDEFETFLWRLNGGRGIRDQALAVADELYTNGFKSAWQEGVKLSKKSPKRKGIVEFMAQSDGERLVIACRDNYGELGYGQVIDRIKKCYENGVVNSINFGSGGAGIGSFMAFNSSVSYYAGVEKGRRTVVCAVFPLFKRSEEIMEIPKNIHLLMIAA